MTLINSKTEPNVH